MAEVENDHQQEEQEENTNANGLNEQEQLAYEAYYERVAPRLAIIA